MFDHIIMRKIMAICHRQMSDHNPNAYLIKWQQYEHWYKYYSGGWCTWPTPLKYAESKFKYTEA